MAPSAFPRLCLTLMTTLLLAAPGGLAALPDGPESATPAEPRLGTAGATVSIRTVGADATHWLWVAESTHTGILVRGFLQVFPPEGSRADDCSGTLTCKNTLDGRSPRGTCVDAEARTIDLFGESPRRTARRCG